MSEIIAVSVVDETLSITIPEEIIAVDFGVEQFTITDTEELFYISITEEASSDSFTIADVSETIFSEIIEEVIEAPVSEEVFDFTSSEATVIVANTFSIDTTGTTGDAGATINGHRVVTRTVGLIYHADKDTIAHQSQVLGMSLNAGAITDNINIITMGYVIEPSWSWTPDIALFLGTDGQMTETRPTTGFLLQVAQSISATEIWVDIKTAIYLG